MNANQYILYDSCLFYTLKLISQEKTDFKHEQTNRKKHHLTVNFAYGIANKLKIDKIFNRVIMARKRNRRPAANAIVKEAG